MDFMKLKATLSLDSSEYEQGLNDSEGKAKGFKAKFGKVMKGAAVGVAAITTATAAVGGAFVKATGSVAEYGDHIDKMSQKMGLSAEKYQEWDAILQHSGTSIDTMKASMKTLANAVESGNEAFQRIGLTQEQIANMSQEELFEATISGLQNVEDTTERTYLAGKLLGRGATELGALLNTSAEDTEAMRQRVHELGGVMSDEAVKAAAHYQDSLQDMTTALEGAKRNMMSSFLPSITTVMDGIGNLFSGDSGKGLGQVKEGVSKFITTMTEAIPKVMSVGASIIKSIGMAILENLPSILNAGINAIAKFAEGIGNGSPEVIPKVIDVVMLIAETIINNLPKILQAAAQLIIGFAKGLINALPKVAASVARIGAEVVKGLGSAIWGKVKEAAEGIKQRFLSVIDTIKDGASSAFESVKNTISEKLEAAKRIVTGWISTIKGLFPFSIGKIFSGWVPKISLHAKKSEDGTSASTDTSVTNQYFAKAMSQPYLFNKPTILNQIAGDHGDEMLYGRSALMRDIAEASGGGNQITNYFNIYDATNPEDVAEAISRRLSLQMRSA